ncbi:TIGR03756 family integrating conjugative element protein [Legionella maceachernii]|uniref:TraU protein n=1 Tax=Legionella maceachernii TaxID=466 RepID=A0A0W0VV99_9GAMM|nr:TIGR03756 family integrating conjugative element protein [Legionella maceachernii]KTD23925.1 TraU protein [Legionella maceachernii]SKA18157.1 integrating conjugative element protein, PFL_4710 family [Legionella maceachernii]SUP04527.1 integrating conjugative element protein, PFL_4710 family [Legionella maceachernii]
MKTRLISASLLICVCVHAQESINPRNPISTLGIATKVLSKTVKNSHYKIIGSCTWAVTKPAPQLIEVPAVEQFIPDLIVTVANHPESNPWIEAKALYENPASIALYQKTYQLATGFPLAFGDTSAQISTMHTNEARTRVVNVIGSPAGFYRLPEVSHKPETQFGFPYYLSEADAISDRTEIAEIAYMATHPQLLINHTIGKQGQVWGNEIPRIMQISNPSRFRASVVAALHAADIVTNKNSLHVTQSTKNSCGKNCVVANVIFDPQQKQVIWQEVYPKNRNISFAADDEGITDELLGNGNYIFVVWRKYRGCVQHEGKLILPLSFPKVSRPQKR